MAESQCGLSSRICGSNICSRVPLSSPEDIHADLSGGFVVQVEDSNPLVGTWVTNDEDSDVAIEVNVKDGEFRVSAFCISDDEPFTIRNLTWDGSVLRFEAVMPSTSWKTVNSLKLRSDGRVDFELTLFEIWKKKDAQLIRVRGE